MTEKNENEILKKILNKKTEIKKVVGTKCYSFSILHMSMKFQHNRFVNKKKTFQKVETVPLSHNCSINRNKVLVFIYLSNNAVSIGNK